MTLFVLLSLVLAAATLALLAWRGPAVAHVTDPTTAAAAATRPTRGLVTGLSVLVVAVAGGGYAMVGSPRLLPVTPDAPAGPGPAADAQVATLQARAGRHPDDAAGWFQAGRAQLETGHAAEALQDYRSALALRPNDPDAIAAVATVLARTGHASEAAQTYRSALAAHPNDLALMAGLAGVLAESGQDAEAIRQYRAALALRPADANLMADLADVLAVTAPGHLDGEPMQLVDHALAIDPDQVKALALKGSFAMTQHDFRTALGAWNHAVRVAPPGDPIAGMLKKQLDGMRAMAARAAASTPS